MEELTWNEVFAIAEHFDVSDVEVCIKLKIDISMCMVARNLQETSSLFQPTIDMDFKKYSALFPAPKAKKDTTENADDGPAKRGRKTRKIKDAYEAIPRDYIPVDGFIEQYGVSLSVLRRHKHFDHIPETGQVNVRKKALVHGGEKVLCIWRDQPVIQDHAEDTDSEDSDKYMKSLEE